MKLPAWIGAATLLAATPAAADVAPCLWSRDQAQLEQAIAAPDDDAFLRAFIEPPSGGWAAALQACGIPGDALDSADMVRTGYAATLRLQRRLAGQWSPEALAAAFDQLSDAERGDVVRWMASVNSWRAFGGPEPKAGPAVAKLYAPFGRQPPQTPGDDLDDYWRARFSWWLGEALIRQAQTKAN